MILHYKTTVSTEELADLAQQANHVAGVLAVLDDLPIGTAGRCDLGIQGLEDRDIVEATVGYCDQLAASGRDIAERASAVADRIRSVLEWEGEQRLRETVGAGVDVESLGRRASHG